MRSNLIEEKTMLKRASLCLLIISLAFGLLASCSGKEEKTEEKKEEGKSAAEIVEHYSRSVAISPEKARKAEEAAEERGAEEEKAIKELDN